MKNGLILLILVLIGFVAFPQVNRANTKKAVPYRSNYQRMSAGSWHTLEIRDGTLWAWGRNQSGELGDGTLIDKNGSVQIGTDNNWVCLSAGQHFSSGIKSNGTLWTWGNNAYGQLGQGTQVNSNIPSQVSQDSNWVSICAGAEHSIGLKSDGTLWAWGRNNYGQLGDETLLNKNIPIQTGLDNNWVSISAGESYTLALKSNGTLWAWGRNDYGQLGDGTLTDKSFPVQIGTDNKWVFIAAGKNHTLGLKSNGTLWAWGANDYGQLGNETNTGTIDPLQIGFDNNWVSVSSAESYSFALKADGTLWSWGQNDSGQLGNGNNISTNKPNQIGADNLWVSIETGADFAIGLKANGFLWSWGSNSYGQLGDNTNIIRSSPVRIGAQPDVWLSVIGGGFHSIGLKSNGTLWAWGMNNSGMLGDGTTESRSSPVQITRDSSWVGIAAGEWNTFALKSDGTLWAWGYNNNGGLGDGTVESRSCPTQIGTDRNWVSVAAGIFHSVGLKSDGSLWAWGGNEKGQIGDGTYFDRHIPVQIGTDKSWIGLGSAVYCSFGQKCDGTLWAWGYNIIGQLGDGTRIDRNIPVPVGTDSDWIKVASSNNTTHGLKSDGTQWAWGMNGNGEFGIGSLMSSDSPIKIGFDNRWIQIGIGTSSYHTLGLKSNGTLWSWGGNFYGGLGDGTFNNSSLPINIGIHDSWVSIAAGDYFSVGLKSDRIQFCSTGDNGYGSLGNGTAINSNILICSSNISSPAPINTTMPENLSICSGTSTILSASGKGVIGWYSESSGGVYLGGGGTFTTNVLYATSTFFVQDSIVNSCVGNTAVRIPIQIFVTPIPTNAESVMGPTDVCQGQNSVSYSIPPIPDATGYLWTLPYGATIVSGENTHLVNIDFSTNALSGIITVSGTNDSCVGGSSPAFEVTLHSGPSNLDEPIEQVADLQTGLAAFYPFNGNADDESGNGNDGIIYEALSTSDRKGEENSALYFNGIDSWIQVPNSPSLQSPQNEITLSSWILAENTTVDYICKIDGPSYNSYQYRTGFDVITGAFYYGMNEQDYAGTSTIPVTLNEWFFHTITYNGQEVRLYINGVLSQNFPLSGTIVSNPERLEIGRDAHGPIEWLKGKLDDLRVYNRALTPEEVYCLYTGDCQSLVLTAEQGQTTLCRGGTSSLTLFNAQQGVSYQVMESDLPAGQPQVGNADTLIFNLPNINSDKSYTIIATDTTTRCSITLDSTFIVEVNDISAIALAEMPSEYIPATVDVSSHYVSASTYEWLLDGVEFASTPQSQIIIDSTGTHTIVLLVNSGPPDYCTDADTLYLTTTELTEVILEIPSSFTPNADGINDYFEFLTEGIDNYTVWLKDAWGVLVYEYDKSTGKWDGLTTGGKEAPAGPYYYHIEARDYTQMALERSGVVYLIRDLIELSPNPAKDKLVVKMNGRLPGERNVKIVSANGAVVAVQILPAQNECQLDISHLKSGLYMLVINNGIESLSISFIKE